MELGSVRGYPESPAAGDNGFFLSSEYRIPLPKFETETELGSVSSNFIPFVDWAETEVNQPMSYESEKSLLGAGVGLEMKFSNGLFSRLDLATPLREIKNSDPYSRAPGMRITGYMPLFDGIFNVMKLSRKNLSLFSPLLFSLDLNPFFGRWMILTILSMMILLMMT